MPLKNIWSAPSAVLAAGLTLAGCGHSVRDSVIVRVGQSPITKSALVHWMSVIAPEHAVPDPPRYSACIAHQEATTQLTNNMELKDECRRQYQALRRQALDFLISSMWLTGEAAKQRVDVSDQEVAKRLDEKGHALFAAASASTDIWLVIRAELASIRIRQLLTKNERKVTQAEIAKYYARSLSRFERPERRYFEIVEKLTYNAAMKVVTRGIKADGPHGAVFHESLARSSLATVGRSKKAIFTAIFAARLRVISGPYPLNGYSVFEVTQIVPAAVQPLARASPAIRRTLASQQQRRTFARFITAWRRTWTAKTDCSPGYVVQKCSQYRGTKMPEEPFPLD